MVVLRIFEKALKFLKKQQITMHTMCMCADFLSLVEVLVELSPAIF